MTEAFIKLDYACNQKCLFCCTSDDKERLSLKQAKELVDRYVKQMRYKCVSFTGGEPTVVNYLPEIITYVKKLGAKVKLQTNALLLADRDYTKKLISSGLHFALVSFHSYRDSENDRITQVKGSLQKTLNGIQNLVDNGIEVHVAYVITTLNKDLIGFVKSVKKRFPSINSFQFFVPWARARGWENRKYVPRLSDIEQSLKSLFEYCSNNKIHFSTRGVPLCYMSGFEDHSVETNAVKSSAQPMIINDFIDNKPRHSFEDSNAKEPQCRGCEKNSICGGTWNTYPQLYPGELRPVKNKTKHTLKGTERDRRLELLVGYSCNNNCSFCYVSDEKLKFKDKTTEELKKDMLEPRKRGTKELSFLGGEPTIREDIFELIRFGVKQGFTQVKLTTNGRMLSYSKFADELIKAGLTKVLFSIHGSNEEIHDSLTNVSGSFRQLIRGVENIKRHKNVIIETNSTITRINYKNLPEMAKLFIKLGMLSSEFIFVFPHGKAMENPRKVVPKYSEARPYMEKASDIGRNSPTKILMRYVPYCILPNHIEFIADQYDPAEREQVGPGVETLDVIKARRELDRIHVPQCKGCKYEHE